MAVIRQRLRPSRTRTRSRTRSRKLEVADDLLPNDGSTRADPVTDRPESGSAAPGTGTGTGTGTGFEPSERKSPEFRDQSSDVHEHVHVHVGHGHHPQPTSRRRIPVGRFGLVQLSDSPLAGSGSGAASGLGSDESLIVEPRAQSPGGPARVEPLESPEESGVNSRLG